jgi:hypothetical protein
VVKEKRQHMKGLPQVLSIVGIAAASAFGLASCGGDDVSCGTGTHLEGGSCVPDSNTTCGEGTTLMGDECVPDGSVICEQGTRFDMASGTCVVDPSACAEGTVLVGGECVPEDDTLTADLEEAAEPNDAAGAGDFNVPALNADVTLHGCISPRAGARDEDIWIMTATAPTLLEITADGVGGLAAGFLVQDNAIPSLPNYFRAGLNLTGDTSKRQVFLPAAGDYLLVMDDSRAILVDEVAGGPETCYYTTVKTVAMPAATTLTMPTQTGEDVGDVRVLTFTADAGDILRVLQTTTSESLSPAFVVMRNNTVVGTAAPSTNPTTGASNPPQWFEGGMNAAEVVTVVVDNQYNFSPNPTPYTLTSSEFAAQALPTDGSAVTVTGRRAGTDGATDITKLNYLYFDVPSNGALLQWNLTASIPLDMVLVRSDLVSVTSSGLSFQVFGIIDAPGGATPAGSTSFNNQFTRFLSAGRYYLMVQNPLATATVGETYTINSTIAPITPTALTYGTAVTAQALPASGAAFHTIDLTNPTWIELAATGTNWGTNINVNLYDLAGEGIVGLGYNSAFASSRIAAGTNPAGRVMVGDTRDFLVRVTSSTPPATGPTYDLNIRTRPYIDLGTIQPGTPINRTADAIAQGSSAAGAPNATRYLVKGLSFAGFQAVVTPAAAQSSDITIRRLNADETVNGSAINAGADGAAETLTGAFGTFPNFIAFTVGSADTEDSTIDVAATSTNPPYIPMAGTLPYTDACAGGTTVMTAQDDTLSAAITLPAAMFATFPFFGTATTGQIKVSSNGWLTFDTATTTSGGVNVAMPNASAPNAIAAAYWDDLINVTVCTKANVAGDTFTIQWTGNQYNVPAEVAQFQAVLHANGVIDFIYGPNHTLNGSEIETGGSAGATVGVENAAGTSAIQVLFNQNMIAPSTSRTLTPG